MLSMSELKQQFSSAERSINLAAQACRSDAGAPPALKEALARLEQRQNQAHQLVEQGQDESRIVQCIDELEQLGDRARDAVRDAANIGAPLKNAVLDAHRALSKLKRQLH